MEYFRTMRLLLIVACFSFTKSSENVKRISLAEYEISSSQNATSFTKFNDKFIVTILSVTKNKVDGEIIQLPDMKSLFQPPMITPIFVRSDNYLWLLDSGVKNLSETYTSEAQIIQAEMEINGLRVISSSKIPKASFVTTFAMDETHLYIADFNKPGLIVFDKLSKMFETLQHHYFHPSPLSVPPKNFLWNRKNFNGIYGLALSSKYLYFHALASKNEFKINITLLKEPLDYNDAILFGTKETESGVSLFYKNTLLLNEFTRIGCLDQSGKYHKISLALEDGIISDFSILESDFLMLVNTKMSLSIEKIPVDFLLNESDCQSVNERLALETSGSEKTEVIFFASTNLIILSQILLIHSIFY